MQFFQNLSLRTKFIGTVAGSTALICVLAIGVAIYFKDVEFREGLVNKSRLVHGRLLVAAKYVAEQGGLQPMIERFTKQYKSSSELTDADKAVILQQVPIYAAMKIGRTQSEEDHYQFRVFSNEPRNKDNLGTAEELAIFNQFESNPSLPEIVTQTSDSVTVFRPIRLSEKQGCLKCHGDPATSPWGNGQDILGNKMENWKDGKLHGVFAVSNDLALVAKAQAAAGSGNSTLILTVTIVIGSILSLLGAIFVVKGPIQSLSQVAEELFRESEVMSKSAGSIAGASANLSEAAVEQASSLEETSASLTEISSMVAKAAENASDSAKRAQTAQMRAHEGQQAVEQMTSSMGDIKDSNEAIMSHVDQSNKQLGEIVKVIQDIGEKTKVINEIVFQTKLLSFNASVEAARAGEHGKGFAVVAEEIGNLAQMSGTAAQQIGDLLNQSTTKVQHIVSESRTKVETLVFESRKKVDTGVATAHRCAEVLQEIVSNGSDVAHLANEISQATSEQSTGISEINKALTQLDSVTQMNRRSSEETAGFADRLTDQSKVLNGLVQSLFATVSGGSHDYDGQDFTSGTRPGFNTDRSKEENSVPTRKNAA